MFTYDWGKYIRNSVILIIAILAGYAAGVQAPLWVVLAVATIASILQQLENPWFTETPHE